MSFIGNIIDKIMVGDDAKKRVEATSIIDKLNESLIDRDWETHI